MNNPGDTAGYIFLDPIRKLWLACLVLLLLMSFNRSRAQHPMDYAIHANIIYHFTKYIDWPDDKKTGDFIIGVVGDSPVFKELKKIVSGKTVYGRRIILKKFPVTQVDHQAHIIFIPEEESDNLKKVIAGTADMPVLLVGEEEGMSLRGTCINFAIVNERLKLEINKKNIESRNLSIASELLSLGKIVK